VNESFLFISMKCVTTFLLLKTVTRAYNIPVWAMKERLFGWSQNGIKGLVHPEKKIIPYYSPSSHPRGIQLSSFSFFVLLKKYPGSSKLHNGSEWSLVF